MKPHNAWQDDNCQMRPRRPVECRHPRSLTRLQTHYLPAMSTGITSIPLVRHGARNYKHSKSSSIIFIDWLMYYLFIYLFDSHNKPQHKFSFVSNSFFSLSDCIWFCQNDIYFMFNAYVETLATCYHRYSAHFSRKAL